MPRAILFAVHRVAPLWTSAPRARGQGAVRVRESFERPSAMKPGGVPSGPTPVKFELQDICHTFLPGHRLMVQVQSSWFPLVDRNPQQFVDIYQAKESDFRKATHRDYRSSSHPSFLEVGVWKP